jgi:hypothetical protein
MPGAPAAQNIGARDAKYRHLQRNKLRCLQHNKNIGAYGALNKRHRRNNSVPAAQNNMYGAQEKPAPAVQKRCLRRDENGAYSSENMAHAVLVIDVFPIRSCMLLCAHLRPISLYIFPFFSIYFHFIPLLLSFEKPCH